jgi:hypothetical protein
MPPVTSHGHKTGHFEYQALGFRLTTYLTSRRTQVCRRAPRGSKTFELAAALALTGWLERGQHVKDRGIHETKASFGNHNFGA